MIAFAVMVSHKMGSFYIAMAVNMQSLLFKQFLIYSNAHVRLCSYYSINGEAYNIKYSYLMIFMSPGGSECVRYN